MIKTVAWIVGIIVFLLLAFSSFVTVGAGQVGVETRLGAVVSTMQPGLHFKMPFIEHVVKMDVQVQKEQVQSVEAASQDLQTVHTDVTLNFHLNPAKAASMYANVGEDYASKVVDSAIQESVKAVTAKYTAEQLITQREMVRQGVIDLLSAKLAAFDITTDALNITNFAFSDQFNTAIEAKVTAEQNALAAQNKLAQVQAEAQQTIAKAKADAEAIQIQAEAINSQGGADYVALQAINKWDGHYPTTYMGSASAVPLISFPTK